MHSPRHHSEALWHHNAPKLLLYSAISPLMQALRSEQGANIDRGVSDVNTGEMTAVMSYDQVSYLLTVMVTVSVVSILILIFSVTLILGFLW